MSSIVKQKKRNDMARGDSPPALLSKSFVRTVNKHLEMSERDLLVDSDSMEIGSRHSESHRIVRASQMRKDTMKRDVAAKRQRKYMSQTARRDKKKRK